MEYVYIIVLVDTYRRYYLWLIDTIINNFVIFIIDTNTNTNVFSILICCLNRYCIGDTTQFCIYIYIYIYILILILRSIIVDKQHSYLLK